MADVILKNTAVAIEKETDEGVYVAPSAASSFISPLADGVNELTVQNKEILERTNVTANLDKSAGRGGIESPSGTIPLEFKAGDSAAAPEYGDLVESALGSTSAGSQDNVSDNTTHTTTVIYYASTTPFSVGDIVLVKDAGKYHVSPISTVTTNTSITLLVPMSAIPAAEVAVDVLVKYDTADSGHPSFSVTKYNTGADVETSATVETAAGCKVTSMSIDGWTTGQYITSSFAYEGLSFTHAVGTSSYTPSFDSSEPIVALGACIYKDGVSLPMDAFSVSLENTLSFKTSTCNSNGRIGSRVSSRNITGSITPYKQDDSVSEWDDWDDDTTFSLFAYGYNPTSTAGQFDEIIAIYIPNCQYQEFTQSDKDGMGQNNITFTAIKHASLPTMTLAFG